MDVLLGLTASYIKYAMVTMASVYVNQPAGTEINFWLLQNDFTENDKKDIDDFAAKYGQKAYCVYVDETKYSVLLDKFDNARWTTSATYRMFAAELLPDTVKRALYLDCDIAVNGDITEMYNLDFGDDLLIASKEEVWDPRNEPENEFEKFDRADPPDEHQIAVGSVFNSGVLLMNLEKFREYKIDANYYADKVGDRKIKYPDQGALALCFFDKVKLLTTCKYNYRIQYSMIDFYYRDDIKPYNRDNFRWYDKVGYEFVPVEAKIIHYTGFYPMRLNPWEICFEPGEIKSYEGNFLGLMPEYADYVKIWWKYAELTPCYDELRQDMLRNKSTYMMMKKILLDYGLEYQNMVGLDTLKVPALRNMNSIVKNDDLNRYVKPRVYRCIFAETKRTLKNLPEDFTEDRGFRLTVKHVHANYSASPEMTACIQILEPNTPDARVYRRYCGRPKKGTWSKWYRIATTDDVDKVRNDAISEFEERVGGIESSMRDISHELEERIGGIESSMRDISHGLEERIGGIESSMRDISHELEERIGGIESSMRDISHGLEERIDRTDRSLQDTNRKLEERSDCLENTIKKITQIEQDLNKVKEQLEKEKKRNAKLSRSNEQLKKEIDGIRASKSYKLGRFFTFIPRKIRGLFKRKK